MGCRHDEGGLGHGFACALCTVLFATTVLPSEARAEEVPTALQQAVDQARAAGKPLLIAFSTVGDWSCEPIESRLRTTDEARMHLQRFAFRCWQADRDPGREVAIFLRVHSVPALLAFDEAGEVRARYEFPETGSPAESLSAFLHRAQLLTESETELRRRVEDDPTDANAMLSAARWSRLHGRFDEARSYYERAGKNDPENRLGIAATAAWEARAMQAAHSRRAQVVDDAISFLRNYDGSEHSTKALRIVALSGDLERERLTRLIDAHALAVSSDREQLLESVYIALAADALESALHAAQLLTRQHEMQCANFLTLAEVHFRRDEPEYALAAMKVAIERSEAGAPRRACELLQQRLQRRPLVSNRTEKLDEWAKAYFGALEHPEGAASIQRLTSFEESDADDRPHAPTHMSPEQLRAAEKRLAEWNRYLFAVQRELTTAAGRCSDYAEYDERVVYIHLRPTEPFGRPREVRISSPLWSRRLRECLVAILSAQPLPPAPQGPPGPLLIPVQLEASKLPARRLPAAPRGPGLLTQSYIYFRGATGITDEYGIGARSVLRLGRLADFRKMIDLSGHLSRVGTSDYAYDVNLLVGLGVGRPNLTASMLVGAGASRNGDRLESAFQIPIEICVTFSGRDLRGLFWTRSVFVLDSDRRSAPSDALFGGDETHLGLGVRVPARGKRGAFVGVAYQHALDRNGLAALLGVSVDSF